MARNPRVRLIAAPEGDMQRARRRAVVGIGAAAGEEAQVLGSLDARADDFRPGMDFRRVIHKRRRLCARSPIARRRGRTGWWRRAFDAADLGQRFLERRGVPGIARNDAGIERRAQADRIGGEQKRPGFVERHQRAGGAGRMAGQGDQRDAAIAEQIALAVDRVERRRLLPFGRQIAGRFGVRRAGCRDFRGVDDEAGALEEGVAAAMVGVQVRAHDHIDVVGDEANTAKRRDHVITRLHDRGHDFGETAPPCLRVLSHRRMTAGVEQHIALAMAEENARHWYVERLAAHGARVVHRLAYPQPSAGQDVHLHRAAPARANALKIGPGRAILFTPD